MLSIQASTTHDPVKSEDLRALSIGIALSGGGYRAAAFHLGALAYLHRIKLLPQLRMLSTVSGGTFTGAKYILSLVEGLSFPNFFSNYYEFLRDTDLIKEGLNRLSQGSIQVPSGQRNLILSMAQVYAETFLKISCWKALHISGYSRGGDFCEGNHL